MFCLFHLKRFLYNIATFVLFIKVLLCHMKPVSLVQLIHNGIMPFKRKKHCFCHRATIELYDFHFVIVQIILVYFMWNMSSYISPIRFPSINAPVLDKRGLDRFIYLVIRNTKSIQWRCFLNCYSKPHKYMTHALQVWCYFNHIQYI